MTIGKGMGPEVADLMQVDRETGEVRDGVLVLMPKRKVRLGGFVMVWQAEALTAIAQDRDFTVSTHRVLWGIISKLDYENYIQLDQTALAKELDLAREVVNRQLSLLVKKGLLVKGPQRTFRLADTVGWKGRTSNLVKERQTRLKGLKVIDGGLSKVEQDERRMGYARNPAPAIEDDETPPSPGI